MNKENVVIPRYSVDQMREIVVKFQNCERKVITVRDVDDHSPAVFMALDAYTAVFNDECMRNVLEWLGVDMDLYSDDIFKTMHMCHYCGDDNFMFAFNGILVFARKYYFYGYNPDTSIFDLVVPQVRIDVKGIGLQWLREIGFDPDRKLRDPSYLLPSGHVTRVDFAYDFIDYMPNLYYDLKDYCENNQTDTGRISCGGTGGVTCTIQSGSRRLIYLGSNQSTKMLRVYDKKLEMTDRKTGLLKENIYACPNSWIRIEWQIRDDTAHKMCLDSADMLAILKELYKSYQFQDVANTTKQNRRPSEFWINLFNWEELPNLAHNIQIEEPDVKKDELYKI